MVVESRPQLDYTRQWCSAHCYINMLRGLANDGGEREEAGCSTQRMAQKNIAYMYLFERQDHKQVGMGKDGTGRCGTVHKKKKTTLDGTRGEDEGSKTGCAVCRPWTRVRKGSVEEAHRERPGRKLDMKKSVAWIRRVERRSSWRRTEMDGVTVSPDVKTCTGRTKY